MSKFQIRGKKFSRYYGRRREFEDDYVPPLDLNEVDSERHGDVGASKMTRSNWQLPRFLRQFNNWQQY